MSKRFIILLLVLSVAGELYAQWTKKDSLNLQRIINGNGELKLNPEAVKRIDFGSASDSMQESKSKGWLQPDETLPKVKYTEIKEEEGDSLCETVMDRRGARLSLQPLGSGSLIDSIPSGYKKGMALKLPPLEGISLGNGFRLNGGTISGFDLMYVFRKSFWCRKKKKRREHTLVILQSYK
ncbi:DUF4858 domain-containing protein [Bacteroides salyersiae]|jgi:hypothetical protein|uniref:DUF4858 domain-containing protein n=1 Tax=Bacteroides salyersiae TaxID=291644 RepID=UPI001C8B1A65|nr:DUF4858 domain-containing protein [Bacteroides salyersiae]